MARETSSTTAAGARPLPPADPDELLARWHALLREHHHLHSPEAAQRLGVPEAALFAARIGTGSTRLEPDIRALLATLPVWGKLLLAVRGGLGVMLGIANSPELDAGGVDVNIHEPGLAARFDASAVAEVFLLEDSDAHGRTVSLNWFDGAGAVMGRVFLLSKSQRRAAMSLLLDRAHASQVHVSLATARSAPVVTLEPLAGVQSCAGLTGTAAACARAAILASAGVARMLIRSEGPGGAQEVIGRIDHTSETPPAAHATGARCKLHLRPAAATAVSWVAGEEGSTGIRMLDSQGGSVTLVPAGSSAADRDWHRGIPAAGG